MGKPPKKPKLEDTETDPGAWERFERTVRRMVNTPPKPHKPIGKVRDAKAGSKPRRKKEHAAR